MSREREAQRQQALMRSLLARDDGVALQSWLATDAGKRGRALQAYQANAGASAESALASTFPTVQALVGDESFAALARALWQARPPTRGDLAWFGSELADFISDSEQLADVPYLADIARLEWAYASAERDADAEPDLASLALLAQENPSSLRLVLASGAAVLRSAYPIVSIWRVHHDDADPSAARDALAASRGETAFVWRQGWRARMHAVDEATARWSEAVLRGEVLSDALVQAGEHFAFEAWLQQAITEGWLQRAQRVDA